MLFWLLFIAVIAILLYFVALAWLSQKPPLLGLASGKLRPCPNTPNCVCSEYTEHANYIAPIMNNVDKDDARQQITLALRDLGGRIQSDTPQYVWASFSSPLFRYVDDVEVRISEAGQVHIRSASRVGHSDFGQNLKRVEALRAKINQ